MRDRKMKATIVIHLDLDDNGNPVWWAECEQIPRTTVVGESLMELRELIAEAIEVFNVEKGAALVYGNEILAPSDDEIAPRGDVADTAFEPEPAPRPSDDEPELLKTYHLVTVA